MVSGPAFLLLFTFALLIAGAIVCRLLGVEAWAVIDWLSDLPQDVGERLRAARRARRRLRS
jgi:hypothetical protein